MSQLKRWDFVWKELCNPNKVWGPAVIAKLLGEEYASCDVEFSDLNTELPNYFNGYTLSMDKLIVATVDSMQNKIHFEFQSTFDPHGGLRFLKYDINTIKESECKEGQEHIMFPTTRIISVRDTAYRNCTRTGYPIYLHFNGQEVTLRYPVVDALSTFAGLKQIMNARTVADATDGFVEFIGQLPNLRPGTMALTEMSYLCSLLTQPAIFEDGVDIMDSEVKDMAGKFNAKSKGCFDEVREATLQEALQQVMSNLGVSKERAMEILGIPKDASKLTEMHLG